jgi:hypothetical protein
LAVLDDTHIFYIKIPTPHYLIFLASGAATSPLIFCPIPRTTSIAPALFFCPSPHFFSRLAYSTAHHPPRLRIVPHDPPTDLGSSLRRSSLMREGRPIRPRPGRFRPNLATSGQIGGWLTYSGGRWRQSKGNGRNGRSQGRWNGTGTPGWNGVEAAE